MNTFGRKFRVGIFGESHGRQTGAVIDGVPAGIEFREEDIIADIDRRRAGAYGTTARKESDIPHIVSGLYNGHTTGSPLTIVFDNADVRSGDYDRFTAVPRPGHADFTAAKRFGGWNDPRGGGHFSGRLTLPLVAAGVVAKKVIAGAPASVNARIVGIGGIRDESRWKTALAEAVACGDSLGGLVECVADFPAGYGNPFWDGVESLISHAVFAIPGVRGIEFGDGFAASAMKGSEHNDPFGPDGKPLKNGSGGLNGGITNGAPIVFRVAFKPTSSIAKVQETFDFVNGEMTELRCAGRHDVCFALRAPVVVEAVTAAVLADLLI